MSSPIYGPPAHNQLPGSNLLRDAFGKTLEVRAMTVLSASSSSIAV